MTEKKQSKSIEEWNLEIKSVPAATWRYIARERRVLSICIFLAVVAATVLLIGVSAGSKDNGGLPFLPTVILFFLYGIVYAKMHGKFMKQFASANGFTYKKWGSAEEEKGSIFQRGRGKMVSNIVEGLWGGHPIRLYNYQYSIKQGKNESTYAYTIFRTTLDKQMPRIYLDAHGKGNWKAAGWLREGLRRISLESNDFEKIYGLYMQEGGHIPTLQIFTPDLMEKFIHLPKHFDVEIVDNNLYIYKEKYIGKKKDLEEMYGVAKILIENIRNITERMIQ